MKGIVIKTTKYLMLHQDMKTAILDKEIYQYGLEVFLLNLVNIISILLIGFISNTILNAVIFLITFIIIRQLTGGFHFKNYTKCIVTFMLLYILFLVLDSLAVWDFILCLVLIIIDFLYIILNAPIENKNKPISPYIKNKLRIKIVYFLLFGLLIYILFYHSLHGMLYAITLDAILIKVEKQRKKKEDFSNGKKIK